MINARSECAVCNNHEASFAHASALRVFFASVIALRVVLFSDQMQGRRIEHLVEGGHKKSPPP